MDTMGVIHCKIDDAIHKRVRRAQLELDGEKLDQFVERALTREVERVERDVEKRHKRDD